MPIDGEALQSLFGDKTKVSADLQLVKRYVQENLFPRVIFMFNDTDMDEDGYFHKDYMKNCKSIVGGRGMINDNDGEDLYMTHLWTLMAKDKLYKKWLATKRSNTYQAMQDKFFRKLITWCRDRSLPRVVYSRLTDEFVAYYLHSVRNVQAMRREQASNAGN